MLTKTPWCDITMNPNPNGGTDWIHLAKPQDIITKKPRYHSLRRRHIQGLVYADYVLGYY